MPTAKSAITVQLFPEALYRMYAGLIEATAIAVLVAVTCFVLAVSLYSVDTVL